MFIYNRQRVSKQNIYPASVSSAGDKYDFELNSGCVNSFQINPADVCVWTFFFGVLWSIGMSNTKHICDCAENAPVHIRSLFIGYTGHDGLSMIILVDDMRNPMSGSRSITSFLPWSYDCCESSPFVCKERHTIRCPLIFSQRQNKNYFNSLGENLQLTPSNTSWFAYVEMIRDGDLVVYMY